MRNEYLLPDRFSYHPPATKERIEAHNKINGAAKDFALIIDEIIDDPDSKAAAYSHIQSARMMANQGVTYDEIRSKKTKG